MEPWLLRYADGLDVAALPTALSLGVVVVAPVVEEVAKVLGLLGIRDRDPEPEDGYVYGAASGLGFAATENLAYIVVAYMIGGQDVAVVTAAYRSVATVCLHGAASALAGGGLWTTRYGALVLRPVAAPLALALAIALHAAYNALASFEEAYAVAGALALAVLAYLWISRRVRTLDARGP